MGSIKFCSSCEDISGCNQMWKMGLHEFNENDDEYEFETLDIIYENEIPLFDVVSKPKHYADKKIEVIEYIQDTLSKDAFEGYCIGNVHKYISRYQKKNGREDLLKASYYLDRAIESMEK